MFSSLKAILQSFNVSALENRPKSHIEDARSPQPVMSSPSTASTLPQVILDKSIPKVEAISNESEAAYSSEQLLIPDTPCFHCINSSGQGVLQGALNILGQTRFKFSQKNGIGNSHVEGSLGIPFGGPVYHHLNFGVSPTAFTRLGTYVCSRSLGLEAMLTGLFNHEWSVAGQCALLNSNKDLEMQLNSAYVLDNIHVTGGVDYSQAKTEDNRYHYDLLLRHKDFFLGYAWIGNHIQSEDCNKFSHENKFSLGWTARDYIVNFTSSANLTQHSFLLYQTINSMFDQGISIAFDLNSKEVSTELAVRLKNPEAGHSVTVRIGNNSGVGLGYETKVNEQMKLAFAISTVEGSINLGLAIELEI